MKKIIALFVSVVVCANILIGCDSKLYITTGLKDDELFKISGEECHLSEALLVLMTEKSRYEEELGAGIWQAAAGGTQENLAEEIKKNVKNEMIELKLIELFAENQGITVTEEEQKNLENAAKEYMATLTEEQISLLGVTAEDVESLYTSFYKAEKVYNKLTSDVKVEISDEEARVVEINYIFIATCKLDDENNKIQYTEEELEVANNKLAKVQELLDIGSDFVTVARQYSDSDVYSKIFARGETVEAFENISFALEEGETSDAVKTDDGYYFIYCVSDYLKEETNAKKLEKENDIQNAAYEELYNPYKSEQTLEFNDDIWEEIKFENYTLIDTMDLYTIYNNYMH